jgi:L-aspartate oxidase
MPNMTFDAIILGSGAAGLTAALLMPAEWRIALISKTELISGATQWAQGGIAAVLDQSDSVESHISDTLVSGVGLCNLAAVTQTVSQSAVAIDWLIDQGVPFTVNPVYAEPGAEYPFHLTREGGHSHRRIIHAADATGRAISQTLTDNVRKRSNVTIFENFTGIDIVTFEKLGLTGSGMAGLYALDRDKKSVVAFRSQRLLLATGGASKAYLYTSNTDGTSGDGIAMAWRAGCQVANMEFNQFHPTCLYHPHAKSFLISEAVRGEGGRLTLPNGEAFMHKFDERLELAPRDIVARAIDHEMKRLGIDHVNLDISHQTPEFIKHHFPTIYNRCLSFGIDITSQPIPVVPAAHYTCGGIQTDLDAVTNVKGIYAAGECAHTGLHGSNRLASNSLLECLVFARTGVAHMLTMATRSGDYKIPEWDNTRVTDSNEDVAISHNWDEVRRCMWDYVGIVRSDKRLHRALKRVHVIQGEINEHYRTYHVSNNQLELRNLTMVAELMIRSALLRKESRGLHFTQDYPNVLPEALDTLLTPSMLDAT